MRLSWLSALPWRRWQPLGLCLLTAMLLHALVLAGLQLQRSRRSLPAPALTPPDDTPELLRFSSRQAAAGIPAVVPLPGLDLPPPPPPPPLEAPATGPRTAAAPASAGRPGQGAVPQGSRGSSAASTPARRAPAAGDRAAGNEAAAVLAGLELLQRQRADADAGREAGGTAPERQAAAGAPAASASRSLPELGRPAAEQQEAYRALWERAQPGSGPRQDWATLPATLERRRLPLAEARRSALPLVHRDGVLLGDQLLLFWVVGDQLWLLRSAGAAG